MAGSRENSQKAVSVNLPDKYCYIADVVIIS
jgi:hypothetical protein